MKTTNLKRVAEARRLLQAGAVGDPLAELGALEGRDLGLVEQRHGLALDGALADARDHEPDLLGVSNTMLLGGAGKAGSAGWVLWQGTQRLTMISCARAKPTA